MKFGQQLSQQQKQVQKLAMTQTLQQSIQMLHYNTEDLFKFLESKALENPLLDVKITRDYAEPTYKSRGYQGDDQEELNYLNQIPDNQTSLFEHLVEQIHLNYRDTYLRQLVFFLVEYIDVNGYLTITLEDMMSQTGAEYLQALDALTLLQQLEPAGVGARDLQECLMLQIERDESAPSMAYIVIEEHFEDFAHRRWEKIAKDYQISVSEIQKISDYIQLLTPNPGAGYGEVLSQTIYPDIIVKVNDHQEIEVLSTKSGKPTVAFQSSYFERMAQVEDPEVQEYLNEKKAEFEWLKRSVEQRGDTILNVGTEIVKRQKSFFLDHSAPLIPMKLKEIAEVLNVHESTVSRAVNGKYLQTDAGTFELRSFFTTGLSQGDDSQDDVSADSVQKEIARIIAEEDKRKPLSDQKIVSLLKEKDIEISRRTVAKYRDILAIPSSTKRKRFD